MSAFVANVQDLIEQYLNNRLPMDSFIELLEQEIGFVRAHILKTPRIRRDFKAQNTHKLPSHGNIFHLEQMTWANGIASDFDLPRNFGYYTSRKLAERYRDELITDQNIPGWDNKHEFGYCIAEDFRITELSVIDEDTPIT
jgi:hypothetical protein